MSDKEHNLESLFEAAVEIEGPAERQAFLDEACDGDAELRKQVEKLLASDIHAGSFLERPPAELDVTIVHDHSASNQNSQDSSKSVLLTMGFAGEPPRVSLRDTADEGDGPIERPGSSEIPRQETGSRYQLQGEIARGGMGVIVKGRDNDLGRELAIKVLLEEHKANPQVIQRFVEEAQIGGQLQHPGIAPVYELGQFADQRPFFSMKLIKGKTLAALLEERADVSGDRTKLLNTFEQICQTMAYAHSRGVIHRDLKPANIMVGAFGEVQVMDWGLAKVLGAGGIEDEKKANTRHRMEEPSETLIHTARDVGSNLPERFGSTGSDTMMGSVMGTPAYMPPEQALGELDRVDERADVFGLGAILCEILTGKPPYVADSGAEVFRRARRGQLNECLDRLDASSDEKELVSIAKQAIAAETEKRLRNASVLADRIAKYLAGVQERLKQAELSQAKEHERAEHATRRRRLLSVFAGLMLVAAIAAGFAAVEFRRQREANGELAEQNEARRKEVETEKANVEQEKDRVQQYSKRLEEEREALRQEQYLSDMLLAQQAHESGDVGRARKLLLKYVPVDGETDRRTFDWYYWWRSTHLESTSVQLQDQAVMSMAVSPDQRFVATTGIGGELEIRNAKTLERLAFFEPEGKSGQALNVMMRLNEGFSQFIAFSVDGRVLATADGNQVHLWDTSGLQVAETDEPTRPLELTWRATIRRPGNIVAIAFAPTDSRLAITETNGSITIWQENQTEEPEVVIDNGSQISRLAFSPDGKSIAALPWINPYKEQDSKVLIYDLNEGDLRTELVGRQRRMLSLAWGGTAEKSVIATGSNVGNICLWDGATFEDRDTLTADASTVAGLAFSPNGSRLVARLRGTNAVQVWHVADSQVVATIRGHEANVVGAACIDNSEGVISCSETGSLKNWSLSRTQPFIEAGFARTPMASGQSVIDGMDANKDGKVSRDEAVADLKPVFNQYDLNRDGALDATEARLIIESIAGTRFTGAAIVGFLDRNADGGIGRDEASVELKADFDTYDINRDGMIDSSEAQVLADYANETQSRGGQSAEQMIASMDRDGDGMIGREEFPGGQAASFSPYDADGNGLIDREEAKELANAVNLQRRGTSGLGTGESMQLLFGRLTPFRRSLRELQGLNRMFATVEQSEFEGISNNREYLALLKSSGSDTVSLQLFHIVSGKRQLIYQKDKIRATFNRAVDIAIADNGSRVAFVSPQIDLKSKSFGIAVHDVSSGMTSSTNSRDIRMVALSPDGKQLATLSGQVDGLRMLDITAGNISEEQLNKSTQVSLNALLPRAATMTDCVFSPDGTQMVVATAENGMVIIDCRGEQEPRAFTEDKVGSQAITFSRDGSLLASGGEEGLVRIWEFPTGQPRLTLRGHQMPVTGIVFIGDATDGQSLLSIDASGRILAWPTATEDEVQAELSRDSSL